MFSSSPVLELQSGLMSSNIGIYQANNGTGGGSSESTTERPVMRLREPRDLYSTTSLQHPPKWPIECQVIPEKVKHIETVPAKLEPFYVPTSLEPQPKPVGEEMGTIVYDYQPKLSVDYFCRSCVGGSEVLETFDAEPNALKFESRFESGNLAKAIKVTNVYYELHLRQDLYTDRHSQWFYFRIQNTKENLQYRFSIVNFNKPDSLYKYGLKILMYSEKEAQLNKVGWVRCGQNISYFKNDIPSEENGSLYTLTFNLKFRHANDTVFLAHCYPYTYSTLQTYLRTLEDDSFKSELLTVRLLCRSLAGNNVYIVTITSPDNYNDENQKVAGQKPAVVISARVHPGETQSSYMMKGIIDFLTSNSPQAKDLRDRFIFKLIPMLNPDGVIVGNSRCCLLGQDLNRQYRTVLREAFPQIYQTKVLLRRLAETNGIFLYCDIHGHSRRNNVFIYGCENRKFPEKKLIEQVFPLMMHKNSADKFSFQNCKFRVQKNKEGCGRVFAWTIGVVNSYTLEISLGGSTMPSRHCTHFNTADYEATGRHFCETLLDYSDPSPAKERLREKILQKLTDCGSNADEPVNVPVTDYSSLSHSESDDSGDESKKTESLGLSSVVNPLKRQSSLRLSKKRLKPPPKPEILQLQKSTLSLNKASVNPIRLGQQSQNINQSRLKLVIEEEQQDLISQKELAVFKRLTKFRRKQSRKNDLNIISSAERGGESNANTFNPGPKCTSILFDDPFNPPGGSFLRRNVIAPASMPQEDQMDNYEESGSGTEDECDRHVWVDKHDAKNKTFAQDQNELIDEFSALSFSIPKSRLPTDAVPVPSTDRKSLKFPPFIPKLPQGKPLRTFHSMDFHQEIKKEEELPQTQPKRRASLATTSLLNYLPTSITGRRGKVGVATKSQNQASTSTKPKFQKSRSFGSSIATATEKSVEPTTDRQTDGKKKKCKFKVKKAA